MIMAVSFMLGTTSIAAYAEETLNTAPVETSSNTNELNTTESNIDEAEQSDPSEQGDEELTETAETEEAEPTKETAAETDAEETEDEKVVEEAKQDTTAKTEEKYTKAELRLLSALVFAESGNQSYKGKLAVANVVINRTTSKQFWHVDTIKEVIYDDKWGIQFSVIKDNSDGVSPMDRALKLYDTKKYSSDAQKKQMEQCIKAAKAALNGENNIGDYLFFTRYTKSIANKYPDHVVIGAHIFYNTK
jgi:spore germination cell wall hydrolase CwlJ-like protein